MMFKAPKILNVAGDRMTVKGHNPKPPDIFSELRQSQEAADESRRGEMDADKFRAQQNRMNHSSYRK